jgi:hypothetical protein
MMKTQRNFENKSDLVFNKSTTKGERKKRKKDKEARTKEAISFHVLQMP